MSKGEEPDATVRLVVGHRDSRTAHPFGLGGGQHVRSGDRRRLPAVHRDQSPQPGPRDRDRAADLPAQEMVGRGIVTMDRPSDLESCFRMLDLGRTDLGRVNDIVGWTMIDRVFENRTAFRMIKKPVRESIENLIVSKTYPDGNAILQEFTYAKKHADAIAA